MVAFLLHSTFASRSLAGRFSGERRHVLHQMTMEEKEQVEGCPEMSTARVDLPVDASDTFLKQLQNK